MSLNVGVIGAGAMGTAISQCIAPNTNKLLLYARRKEICDDINEGHINCEYHPSVKLHENIKAVNDLCDLKDVDVIFLCIPSSNISFKSTSKKSVSLNERLLKHFS